MSSPILNPPPLTGSEFRGQVALAQLLPTLSTMGQLHVACHFQDGETQTRGKGKETGTEDGQGQPWAPEPRAPGCPSKEGGKEPPSSTMSQAGEEGVAGGPEKAQQSH